MRVFVDTNVLVYARDSSEPAKQARAAQWLEQLWIEHRGRTSTQVLSEYYVTVTRKLKPGLARDAAWEDVEALLAWEPQSIDAAVLRRGCELEVRHGLSWWDSLIVAAAESQECGLLLSEDLAHGAMIGRVRIHDPFVLDVQEPPAGYSPGLPERHATRHGRRGRPRRMDLP